MPEPIGHPPCTLSIGSPSKISIMEPTGDTAHPFVLEAKWIRLADSVSGKWLVGHYRILSSSAECMKKNEKNHKTSYQADR
jgi:hypothetical protein